MNRRALSEIVTLAAFCAFLLFFGLGAFGLVGADEPRYAQIAREMLARHDWVVPVLNGTPWLEKPVLYYWEAMISYGLFGVSDWAARIPGAFSATTMVIAIYVFWSRVRKSFAPKRGQEAEDGSSAVPESGSSAVALDAALITLSTAGVIGFGRAASTDMPLAANFTIAMLCWIARYAEPDEPNESGRQTRMHPRLLLFYAFMALATLAKGPVAPGLAAVIIVLFAAARREAKIVWQTLWWPGILVYLAIAAPWYWLVQQRTGNFFHFFFLEQNLQRYTSNVYRHPQPFWFYIPVTLLALAPWVAWSVCGWWSSLRGFAATRRAGSPVSTQETQLELFLAIWAIVPVVFFSFSGSKLPGYILPAVPAWGLLAAASVYGDHAKGAGRTLLILLHSAIAAGLVAAVIIAPYRTLRVPVSQTAAMVAGIAGFAIFAGIAATLLRRGMAWLRFVTLVPVVLAVAYILRIGAPAIDAKLSARPVAQELARIETQPVRVAVLHVKRELEYGLNFYRNQPIASYDRAEIPATNHLVVARAGSESELTELVGGRRVVRLGEFAPQGVEFFWVTNQPAMSQMH